MALLQLCEEAMRNLPSVVRKRALARTRSHEYPEHFWPPKLWEIVLFV